MEYRIISSMGLDMGIYDAPSKGAAIRTMNREAGCSELDRDDGLTVVEVEGEGEGEGEGEESHRQRPGIVAERADRRFELRQGVHAATQIVAEWQDGRWVFLENGQDMECSCLGHLDPLTHLRAIYGAEAVEEV